MKTYNLLWYKRSVVTARIKILFILLGLVGINLCNGIHGWEKTSDIALIFNYFCHFTPLLLTIIIMMVMFCLTIYHYCKSRRRQQPHNTTQTTQKQFTKLIVIVLLCHLVGSSPHWNHGRQFIKAIIHDKEQDILSDTNRLYHDLYGDENYKFGKALAESMFREAFADFLLFNVLPSVNCAMLFFFMCATVPSFRKELVTCRKERPLSEQTELNALQTTDTSETGHFV